MTERIAQSNEPISVGDLVQVVKPIACGCVAELGIIFRVLEIRPTNQRYRHFCTNCNATVPHDIVAVRDIASDLLHPIWTLKRIPPLSELEGEKTKEDMREPA